MEPRGKPGHLGPTGSYSPGYLGPEGPVGSADPTEVTEPVGQNVAISSILLWSNESQTKTNNITVHFDGGLSETVFDSELDRSKSNCCLWNACLC